MWVHAFNTILKYKKKAAEMKGTHENPHEEHFGEEDEGFKEGEAENEGEGEIEENNIQNRYNQGDYMEDDGRRMI